MKYRLHTVLTDPNRTAAERRALNALRHAGEHCLSQQERVGHAYIPAMEFDWLAYRIIYAKYLEILKAS